MPFQRLQNKLTRQLQKAREDYLRLTSHFTAPLKKTSATLGVIAVIASVVCLASMIVRGGFNHSSDDLILLSRIIRVCHIIFLANIIFSLTLNFRETVRLNRVVKWIVDIAVLTTLLPLLYPHPEHPWIPILEKILYSNYYLYSILGVYSAVEISYGIMAAMGKRTNPSLILSASFLLFIFIGSLVLMMPKCTVSGISYIDSLFVSTSAVCITGLTTVDVSQTFTPVGLIVIAVMVQVGGLGIMTFTSFFALFFSGNASIYSQLIAKDMIYSKTINALLPTLLYIFGFTIAIEAAGAVALFLCVHNTLGLSAHDEIVFSAFHALSAFCNAGFSNIEGGLSNPLLLRSNQMVYLVASVLIFAGGIGFPILVNFRQAIGSRLKSLRNLLLHGNMGARPAHIYDLNTKVVLVASGWIIAVSTILFFLFEYDNSLAGMPWGHKIIQSLFNSFVPRSSGFSSVNPTGFLNITLLMFVVLMWIGGGSQSTAGGIKVNTFATMILNLRAVVLGRQRITAFGRTISVPSLRRAHAVIALSIVAYVLFAILLVALEPRLPTRALLYEAASALFTVGSSLGVTPYLSIPSKALLSVAMFLGRVGIISLLVGIVGTHTDPPAKLPVDNIIIN